MALPNLVTGSLRSKIDRILAFKQVVSTVALHGTKHDTTLHSSVRLFRCSTCRGTPIQAAKEYEKTRSLLPLHGSQASIANSFAVPVKETWSTTVGDLDSLGGASLKGSSDKALADCKLESKVLMSPTCGKWTANVCQ